MRRVIWFVALYLAGLAAIGVVAFAIRTALT
ncbi:MAG: hypothetical protein ACJAW4_003460 [Paracoccaceae bacterium]|jgi:hypothetical protein